jgi:tRNA pseudouridine38-40 synthase
VSQAAWRQTGSDLVFDVAADAFLYHMVRRLVVLQVTLAQRKINLPALLEYLDPAPGSAVYVQGLAPAQGLCLVRVEYPPEKLVLENIGSF